uniref:Neural proliferation, differentiation and control, 1 n=1 Tax=Nothobranchius kuhntae TaxID=321403 RepID=A0A1A8IQW4_NOTKU
MLLLSSPRCGYHWRASLLLLGAVLLSVVVSASASLPAHSRCPSRSTCTLQNRHQCQLGSSSCGPCFSSFQEGEGGLCVKRSHQSDKMTTFTDLDEEIDFLHSVIEKQQVSRTKTTHTQPKQSASISFQTDFKDTKTVASKPRSQNRLLGGILRSTTAAPSPAPNTPTSQSRITEADGRAGPIGVPTPDNGDIIVIMVSLCVVVGSAVVILATVCYVKLKRESRLAEKVDFKKPAAPAATANSAPMGDKTLAHSAQMYHFQHQKQQMCSMGNHKPEQKVVDSEVTSDEEDVGGGFTVYECPGLAPTGEMEVKNPLFDDSNLDHQGNLK